MRNSKLLGILAIIPTTVLMLWTAVALILVLLFGIGSHASLIGILPFFSVPIIQLSLLIFSFHLSLKLLKNQSLPIKENNLLSYLLIAVGVFWFVCNFVVFLHNNFTGFPGGELQPVLAFLWGVILVIFGIALYEKNN